jgi:hypothetical protein
MTARPATNHRGVEPPPPQPPRPTTNHRGVEPPPRGLAGLGVTGYTNGAPPRTTTAANAIAFKSLNSAKHAHYVAAAGAASPYAQPQPRPTAAGHGSHRAWSARASSTTGRPRASSPAAGGTADVSGDAARLDYRVMAQHRDASYRRDAGADAAVGLCRLNQVEPYPIAYNLSNP